MNVSFWLLYFALTFTAGVCIHQDITIQHQRAQIKALQGVCR